MCIMGVCFVLQPWREAFPVDITAVFLGYLTACICGVFWTLEMLIIYWYSFLKSVGNQMKTLFWACITATVTSAIGMVATEEINFNLSWSDWLLVFGHSACFGLVLPTYTYSCSVVPGMLNAFVACTSTIYLVVAQYTFLSHVHPGNHNWIEILGVVLVIISSTVPPVVKARDESNTGSQADSSQE